MIEKINYVMEDESLDDLELNGLYIIQKNKGFRFGTDAVLLSHFARVKNNEKVMDFCTGSAIIPILIASKTSSKKIDAVEIQSEYVNMARRSVLMNGLSERITIFEGDLKDQEFINELGIYDVVTVNPPYKKELSGIKNLDESISIARHEVLVNLDQVVRSASKVLKDNGRLCMVHRPQRLIEIIDTFRKFKIEPKRIRMVSPKDGKEPNIVLIEGFKGQKPDLKWESELKIYNEDGSYTKEVKEIYGDQRHG